MTDKELLELAAKAAGIQYKYFDESLGLITEYSDEDDCPSWWWNPLTDDGDALRLAVKLGGELRINLKEQWASFSNDIGTDLGWYVSDNNPSDATRRAIVRAAAEIGRKMK